MRLNTKFAALVFTSATAACGGGNTTPQIIDSPEEVDSPPAALCGLCSPMSPCTLETQNGPQEFTGIPGLIFAERDGTPPDTTDTNMDGILQPGEINPFPANSCGEAGTNPCDLFDIPMTGANMGDELFFVLAGMPAEFNTGDPANELLLGFELKTQAGGAFIAPRTVNWNTDPTAMESAQLLAMPMGTTEFEAIAYLAVISGGTSIVELYHSTSGSITINEATNGKNMGSVIKGSVAATNFTDLIGENGCTTSLEGLDFGVTQGTADVAKPGTRVVTANTANGNRRKMQADLIRKQIQAIKRR
jgi:hypothetical protein